MQVLDFPLTVSILPTPLESDNGMAPSSPTQRLDKIEPRLENIEQALRLSPPAPMSAVAQLRSRAWLWIAANRVWIIPIVALAVAVSGFHVSDAYKDWKAQKAEALNLTVNGRIDAVLKAQGGVLETLKDIETKVEKTNTTLDTLQPFIHDVIDHQFENASKLPSQAFQERLPAIKNLLAVAKDQNVRIDPEVMDTLRKKMLGIQVKSPEFWPAAAELISYRSVNALPSQQTTPSSSGLPNCTDSPPKGPIGDIDSNYHMTKLHNPYYENCKFTIDSATDDDRINDYLWNKFPTIEFRNCVIVYRGASFSLIAYLHKPDFQVRPAGYRGTDFRPATFHYDGPTLFFTSCVFDFSTSGQTPTNARGLLQALLEQKGPSFQLTPAPHS